jgi:two-component system, LytTR family, response regulator
MKRRAIVVDDERLARTEMRRLLAECPGIAVVGEAEDLSAAVALIAGQKPDVVFLDVQLGSENGFDLLERVDRTFRVVFVTAFDAYAIRAFEVNALDYLLKPVNPDRLAAALSRLDDVSAVERPATRSLGYDDRILLTLSERSIFVKVRDISYITAAGDYSEVFTSNGKKYLQERSLREWEARLPETHFLRIHRQTMVNLDQIEGIETAVNRMALVTLRTTAAPLAVSRRYAMRLRRRFE